MKRSGFTLIELLVAIAVTGVLMVVLMSFMANTVKTNAIESAREDLLMQAQTALDTASNTILQAASASANNIYPDDNAPVSSNPLSWQSDSSTLVLSTAVQDTHGNIIFSDPLHYISAKNNIVFFVQNATLYRRIIADDITGNSLHTSCPIGHTTASCPPDGSLTDNVSSFTVSYYDGSGAQTTDPTNARGVQLALTLATTKYNKPISVTYSERTVFRNQ